MSTNFRCGIKREKSSTLEERNVNKQYLCIWLLSKLEISAIHLLPKVGFWWGGEELLYGIPYRKRGFQESPFPPTNGRLTKG